MHVAMTQFPPFLFYLQLTETNNFTFSITVNEYITVT